MTPENSNSNNPIKLKIKIKEKPKIILKDYQVNHVEKLINILKEYPVACDFSAMGSGKSFTSSFISLYSEFKFKHVIVIGPLSIKNDWDKKKEIYGVPLYSFISYCSLRSVKGKMQLKHGLLNRIDSTRQIVKNKQKEIIDVVDFKPTDLYKKMVNEGVLLIIDEIQSVKNINDQFKACKELIRTIVDNCDYLSPPKNNSRIMLLSGTPFDKEEQIKHFFRLTSIMKHDDLSQFNIQTGTNNWTGFNDIYKLCYSKDKTTTKSILDIPKDNGNNKIFLPAVFNLFQMIIKPLLCHSMHSISLTSKTEKKNAFYSIENSNDRKQLVEGVKVLKEACLFNHEDDSINHGSNGINALKKIQKALMIIELAKVNTIARIVKYHLLSNNNMKIVICVNYTETINNLSSLLYNYNPLILNGSVNIKNRGIIIDKFQEPNNNYRLLIANTVVASTGINLDDQDGNFPRMCFVSPNYCTIQLAQLSDRFRRSLTKSDSVVHFVFGKHACELKVLNALARKSEVMKKTTIEQVEDGVIFPCDYGYFIEDNNEEITSYITDYIISKKEKLKNE